MTTSKQTAAKKTNERKEPEVKKAVQTMLRKIGKPITTPVTIGRAKRASR